MKQCNAKDSLSSLAWSPTAPEHVAVGSWDGSLTAVVLDRASAMSASGAQVRGQAHAWPVHGAPLLDVAWTHDGAGVVAACASGQVFGTDVASGQSTAFAPGAHGTHAAPVKALAPLRDLQAYVSTSWDSTALIWSKQGQVTQSAGSSDSNCLLT